jgi:hypothetical protein
MDRQYLKPDVVHVYMTQEDKDKGNKKATVRLVPYNYGGFSSYEYKGKVYKGYVDSVCFDDACILLSEHTKG